MNEFIIDNINYSREDIKELIDSKSNGYGTLAGVYSSALLGVCNLADASIIKENHIILEKKPQIEFVIAEPSDFHLEDYQNVFVDYDYIDLWSNALIEDNKKECIESILSFKTLQESWDGYGAFPLEVKSASNAIQFLEILDSHSKFHNPTDIFPNPNGTVSLIWENEEDERISLEIGNDAFSYYTKFNTVETEFFNDVEVNQTNIENITRKIKALY